MPAQTSWERCLLLSRQAGRAITTPTSTATMVTLIRRNVLEHVGFDPGSQMSRLPLMPEVQGPLAYGLPIDDHAGLVRGSEDEVQSDSVAHCTTGSFGCR